MIYKYFDNGFIYIREIKRRTFLSETETTSIDNCTLVKCTLYDMFRTGVSDLQPAGRFRPVELYQSPGQLMFSLLISYAFEFYKQFTVESETNGLSACSCHAHVKQPPRKRFRGVQTAKMMSLVAAGLRTESRGNFEIQPSQPVPCR